MHHDLDPLAAHLGLELVGGATGDDLAVVDDRDRMGEFVGLLEVLGREQERRPFADQVADHVPHPEPASRVESGRGLVEEQQARSSDQRAAEVEPATHAARVRLDHPVGGVGQLELLEELVATPPGLGARELVEAPEHPQVLASGQVLVDGRELAGQADDRAELLGLLDDVETGHGRVPRVGPQQGRQDPHGRGLAGTVRPEETEDRALLDAEVEAVERTNLVLAAAIDLDQAFGGDDGHGQAFLDEWGRPDRVLGQGRQVYDPWPEPTIGPPRGDRGVLRLASGGCPALATR